MEQNSKKPNIHSGHRKRVKANVCNNGFSQLEDHRLLELLLFYAIPQADTNELAHRLLTEFGSFEEILKTDITRLRKVNGVGENTAIMIATIGELHFRAKIEKGVKKVKYTKAEDYMSLAVSTLSSERNEAVYIFCFDSAGKLKKTVKLSSGDETSAYIDVRKAVQAVIDSDAQKAVLAHNHPNGSNEPSASDLDSTRSVAVMFRKLGFLLADHIIVDSNNKAFSMYSDPSLSAMFF